jgi:hypothetical protein
MNEQEFCKNGFVKCDDESVFKFRKELIDLSEVDENDLESIDTPVLLFGNTGINRGFCIYTGSCYVWINATTIESAIDFANMIVSIEPL